MNFIPRPYQKLIIDYIIANPRCAIWAGMGMGKTVATLSAIDTLFLLGETPPVLIIAPLRVAQSVWPEEVAKWATLRHLKIVNIHGSHIVKHRLLRSNADIYTINYENLPWLVNHFNGKWPFKIIVADESTKLKNFRLQQGSIRAKALSKVAHTDVTRFIELTGTCAPKGLQDLWGQMWFLDRGQRLGKSYSSYIGRWFKPDWSGFGSTPLKESQPEIEDKLRDICLTIKSEDYFDIKKPIENFIKVKLPVNAKKHYKEMETSFFTELTSGDEIEAFNAASKSMKLIQLSNGAIYTDTEGNWKEVHDAKVQALQDIIEESSGANILVAYHFKSDLARLLAAFPKAKALDSNPKTIKDWNDGKIPILLAHPQSCGHGLSLQHGGYTLVFFSLNWNLENHQQIIERIGVVRQMQSGYNRNVFIHYLIGEDTIDERILEVLQGKASVQEALLNAMKRNKL